MLKMKIEITDAATLPEWMQKHVDGGSLDLAAIPVPEDVTGLKSALQKERESTAAYSKYGKPEQIEAKIAELTEKAKGSGKGADDAQAKLDAMAAEHAAQLGEKDARLAKMMQRSAEANLKAELAKAGFIAEAIEDVAMSAMNRLQYDEDGAPKVVTADGKPMLGSGSDHGATLADLAKEMAEAKPYAVRDQGKGGGGKLTPTQGGTPAQLNKFAGKVKGFSDLPAR